MQAAIEFSRSREENAAEIKGSKLAHRRRLVEALGDGRDWEYTGNCNERQHADGKCACGHEGIRFEFLIKNTKTGEERIVGRKCINIFETVNPELVNAIASEVERLEAEAAARKSAAKKLAQEVRVNELLDEFDAVAWELDGKLAGAAEPFTYRDYRGNAHVGFRSRRRVSREVWNCWHAADVAALRIHERKEGERYPYRWKQYKSLAAFIKRIEEETKLLRDIMVRGIWE